ncbi:ABC transporter ATP-binding protein [Macrococcus equipercicus]|uniref:ABC transporter ATP-binding protein n=1 Tax=Macrococcus equipercicus TaxID=69967 RepID=A0ABQ6R8X5_9STAP|nr:ABC transporter ATP-binding protein [Macrococcus equipercicus]KAA1039583.1 ABC transporter ATP-binding protein [Macrococcus equipercicus]
MAREKRVRERPSATFSDFYQLLKRSGIKRGLFILGIVLTLIGTFSSLVVPMLTQRFIDGFDADSVTTQLILLIVFVFLLSAVFTGISNYVLANVGQSIIKGLRELIWDKFLRLPVSYFDMTKSGESVSRIVNDTSVLKDLITRHFPSVISGILTIVGSVIVLFILDWKMSLLMFIAVPLAIAVIIPLGRQMTKVSRSLQNETADFSGNLQETLSEVRLMKSFNGEDEERLKARRGIQNLYHFGMQEAKINAYLSPLMSTVMMLMILLIIGYGGIRVADGTLTIGKLVAFLLYLFQIIMPLTTFGLFFNEYNKALGATERIADILKHEEEPNTGTHHESLEFGALHFDQVSFSYTDGTPVLTNITFDADRNQTVAFVGPSGSGKSTIFSLIERYYEVDSGAIEIDGVNIKDIPMNVLRDNIGFVAQESAITSGTIRDNILYGSRLGEYKEADIEQAIERSYAKEFIDELEDGLETEVGERGIKLSGGQKQRISIARAFLRNPKILMLDEATASLDARSEKYVQDALTELMQGRTVLVIAHRLSTIINSDNIYFIDNGHLTGSGTHQQLIASHDMYRVFTEQQFGH